MAISDTDPQLRGFFDNGTNTPGYRQGIVLPIGNNRGVWTFGMTATVTLSGVTVPDMCIQTGPNASVQTNGIDPNVSLLLEPIASAFAPFRCSAITTSASVSIDGSYDAYSASTSCTGFFLSVTDVRAAAMLHHSHALYATTNLVLVVSEASSNFLLFVAEFAPEDLADGMVLSNLLTSPGETLSVPNADTIVGGASGGTATITFNCPSA